MDHEDGSNSRHRSDSCQHRVVRHKGIGPRHYERFASQARPNGGSMIWIIASAVELGMWLGILGTKIGSRDRIHARLIEGTRAQATIPFVERRLVKDYEAAGKVNRKAAQFLTKTIHHVSSYRAFEMLVATLIHKARTSNSQAHKVKICLP